MYSQMNKKSYHLVTNAILKISRITNISIGVLNVTSTNAKNACTTREVKLVR